MRRLRIFLSFAGLFAASPAAAAAQGRVEPVAGLVDEAEAIVAGSDGAMWASIEANPGRIVRITTAGAVVYAGVGGFGGFPVNRHPASVASHRGAVWFRLSGGPETFARLRLGNPVTPLSLAYGRPTSLASGPDGALWMTVDGTPDAITRLSSDPPDELAYPLGGQTDPRSIVAGPDRALWFLEGSRLGRITTSGELTYRSLGAAPSALAAGPADSLWYAQGSVVRRLDDPAEYATGSPVAALAAGPDGALWAAVQGGAVRIVPGGEPTTIDIDPAARGLAITAGPDGRMWMTLDRAPYLVKITVPPVVEDAAELDGWLSARVNSNGLEGEARAELRQPDGMWREIADTELYGSTSSTTVRLRLAGLTPGDNIVRVTVATSAGSASSRPITIRLPIDPVPTATPVAGASPTPSPVPVSGPVEGKTRRGGGGERLGQLPHPALDDLHRAHRQGDAPARRAARHQCRQGPRGRAGRRPAAAGNVQRRQVQRHPDVAPA